MPPNVEIEGPPRNAHQATAGHAVFERRRRGHADRSRTPRTIVRCRHRNDLTDYVTSGHKSPIPTIVTVIAIVAHHEECVSRHLGHVQAARDLLDIVSRVYVRLVEAFAIDEGDAVVDLDLRATASDHPLHKSNGPIHGVLEYDDITGHRIRILIRGYEKSIVYMNGGLHRSRRHPERNVAALRDHRIARGCSQRTQKKGTYNDRQHCEHDRGEGAGYGAVVQGRRLTVEVSGRLEAPDQAPPAHNLFPARSA